MKFIEFYRKLRNFYEDTTEDHPLVVTIVRPNSTIAMYVVDSANMMTTEHPDGNGATVSNLVVFPKHSEVDPLDGLW